MWTPNTYIPKKLLIVDKETNEPLIIQNGEITITKLFVNLSSPNYDGYYVWGEFEKRHENTKIDENQFPFIISFIGATRGNFNIEGKYTLNNDGSLIIELNNGIKYTVKEIQ